MKLLLQHRNWFLLRQQLQKKRVLDEDYSDYLDFVKNQSGRLVKGESVEEMIKALKLYEFWNDSIWLIPSTGGFKTATSNNRNVVETAYSAIPTGGDPAFLWQDFVKVGNYNDCPELTKAVVGGITEFDKTESQGGVTYFSDKTTGGKLIDIIAIERQRTNMVKNFDGFSLGSPQGLTLEKLDGYYRITEKSYIKDGVETATNRQIFYITSFVHEKDEGGNSLPVTGQWLSVEFKLDNPIPEEMNRYFVFAQNNNYGFHGVKIDLKECAVNYVAKQIKRYILEELEDGWKRISFVQQNMALSSKGEYRVGITSISTPSAASQYVMNTEHPISVLIRNPQFEQVDDVYIKDYGYPTLYIPTTNTANVTRLAPSPVINNFIPETGSIAMIADVVIDEFEEGDGTITKFGTTLFGTEDAISLILTEDKLKLLFQGIELRSFDHGADFSLFERYQVGVIVSTYEDSSKIFFLYKDDNEWTVKGFDSSDQLTGSNLFLGCDNNGENQTSVRVLNLYSTEEEIDNVNRASALFEILTRGRR